MQSTELPKSLQKLLQGTVRNLSILPLRVPPQQLKGSRLCPACCPLPTLGLVSAFRAGLSFAKPSCPKGWHHQWANLTSLPEGLLGADKARTYREQSAMWQTSRCKEHSGSLCPPAAMLQGIRGSWPWVQAALSSLHRGDGSQHHAGFRCLRSAQLHKGQPNTHSTGNFLLQDTLCTESPKSGRGLRKVSWRGVLGVSVGQCQAAELHKSPSA